ncbi:MOP flippase family protein [Rufibacter latericius]|uniref:Colanic acid exporter n=1 Tax=Rufibacter latericius TaxID=2487040 RepID=A0A3M9MJL3_9BACT|nr:MOP flippase family protein [Rufibacter latericius]RNI25760.1 colanic acid exporter [Rufibacter latericius]
MDLQKQAVSGVRWTSLVNIINVSVQFIQLAILARFLSPSDYGLMAIVSVVIGFASNFKDMGVSNAIIYRKDISAIQMSTLYWLTLLSSALLFLITALVSPLIASFYNDERLIPLLILIASTFIISSFGAQYSVLLTKQLKFGVLAKREIASQLISLATAVSFAIAGYGVYSLIFSVIISSIFNTVFLLIIGNKIYRPSFHFEWKEVKEFINFGLFQMGQQIMNYFNTQIDIMIIGKLVSTHELGLYSVAKNLAMRPFQVINPIITKVTMPVMAKVNDDEALLKNIYLKTMRFTSSLNFPIYLAIIILVQPIVLIIYGNKWDGVAPMIQILSVYTMIRSTANPVGSLQMAKGRADMAFYWNLGLLALVPLGVFIGSKWGMYGIMWAQVALQIGLIFPNFYFQVNRLISVKAWEYFETIVLPLIIALIAGFFSYWFVDIVNTAFLKIAITGTIGFGIYLVISYIFNREFIEDLKKIKK